MFRVFCFLLFSSQLAATEVENEINKVFQGFTTRAEDIAILSKLEKQMPYENALDNAQVMAFKCWFSNVSTPNGISEYKQFLETAKPVIQQANNLNLIQELAVCSCIKFKLFAC